jgi:putative solute:sodium symporter small subunit
MDETPTRKSLSFFRPCGATMRSETRVIKLILISWFTAIVGFQIYIYLLERNYSELLLNELTIFNLPVHFWLTGQFLPLWFIILCVLFNFWMDRHTSNSREDSLRFRVRPLDGEDDK